MSNIAITYFVAVCAGTFGIAAFIALIVVPAWNSYTTLWERVAASFLSLYVLAACLGIGAVVGAAIVWFWDNFV
jgi:hypothetical protein